MSITRQHALGFVGGANQVTDHYLIALARQHGLTLATLDKPLASCAMQSERITQPGGLRPAVFLTIFRAPIT